MAITINTIVKIIILVLVLVVAIFGLAQLKGSDSFKNLFPDFVKTEQTIEYNEEVDLLNPNKLQFGIIGDDANIYFRYFSIEIQSGNEVKTEERWQWYSPSAVKEVLKSERSWWERNNPFAEDPRPVWISIDKDSGNEYFDELSDKNKNFVRSLRGKVPEEVLKLIVERVIANEESNEWYNVFLNVYASNQFDQENPLKAYESNDQNLLDLDGFIIRLNQFSHGI